LPLEIPTCGHLALEGRRTFLLEWDVRYILRFPGLIRPMNSKDAGFDLLYIPAGLVFIVGFVYALFAFCVLPA
jgi:hypothetical protein